MGDVYAWDGNAGDFSDPTQWTDLTNPYITGVPGPSDYADFLSGGEVSGTGDVYELYVGSVVGFAADINAGSIYNEGNITISSGSLNSTSLIYNYGTVYVSGGSLNSNDYLYNYGVISVTAGTVDVAAIVSYGSLYAGPGTTIIATGGTNIFPANGDDGIDIEGAGTFDAANVMSSAGFISVGQSAAATLTVRDGSTIQARLTSLGAFSGGSGTLIVTGAGTDWEDLGSDGGGFASVGGGGADPGPSTGGNGTLVVSDGATMSELTSADIGVTQDSSGEAIVNDASWTIGTFLSVGDGGTGTLVVSNAGSVVVNGGSTADSSSLSLGSQSGANGTVTVSGQGSRLTTAVGGVVVGGGGDGTLVVEGGATASLNDSDPNYSALTLGSESGSNGTVTVSGQGSNLTTYGGGINIGFDGTGYLIITSGASVQATSSDVTVSEAAGLGRNADGTGLLTVSGSGSTFAADAGGLSIGNGGTGYASVEQGATLEVNDTVNGLIIGQFSGASGDLTVTGSGSSLDVTGSAAVGQAGVGSLAITNGATGTVGSLVIAAQSTSGTQTDPSEVTVDGTGTSLTVLGDAEVGAGGVGSLTVSDGAVMTVEGALTVDGPLNGYTHIGGGGVVDIGTDVTVGDGGDGQVLVDGASSLSIDGDLTVADGGTGLVTIAGAGSNMVVGGDATVGADGDGNLIVEQQAFVTIAGDLTIGDEAGSTGTLTLTDSGSSLAIGGNVIVGNEGTGVLADDVGDLTVAGDSITVGAEASGKGTFTLNGADFSYGGNLTIGDSGNGLVIVQLGAQVTIGGIGTSSAPGEGSITIGATLGSTGALDVSGPGTALTSQSLVVGAAGHGSLSVGNGAVLTTNGGATIGEFVQGVIQKVTIDTQAVWAVTGNLTIGEGGIATAVVESGGQIDVGENVTLGAESAASGLLTVTGTAGASTSGESAAPSELIFGGSLLVGDAGLGSLNIISGAEVTEGSGDLGVIDIAAGPASQGTVTVSGAESLLEGSELFVGGNTASAGGAGTLNISAGGIVSVAEGLVYAGSTVTLAGGTLDPSSITVLAGAEVAGAGVITGDVTNDGTIVTSTGGTLEITGSATGNGAATLAAGSRLVLDGKVEEDQSIVFDPGAPETLVLSSPGAAFPNQISGLADGDRIEFGNGMTITSASLVNSNTIVVDFNTASGMPGTYDLTNVGIAANAGTAFAIGKDPVSGDYFISPERTLAWTGTANTDFADAQNWQDLTDNVSPAAAPPGSGDTAVITSGNVVLTDDETLADTMIEIGGTAGSVAVISLSGDSAITFGNPSLGGDSTITSALSQPAGSPETTQLDAGGIFVNEGTVLADGSAGSSFTIEISGTTIAGTFYPGYAYNAGLIQADAGNTLIIDIGASSELFNAGTIVADGGTVQILAGTSAIAGGYAPVKGVAVIEGGGTLETNAAYEPTVTGTGPFYLFGDETDGDTLIIDNIGSFGGRIIGFSAGDTIDLGTSLAVGTLVYAAASSFLYLENDSGTVLAALEMGGPWASGTFAVANGTADGFTLGTGSDGDAVLSTDIVDPLASGTSGTWQSPGSWLDGTVPDASGYAVIGDGASTNFTLTTGSSPVSVTGFIITSPLATVQVTSDTTALSQAINVYAGTLDVLAGNTLSGSALQMFAPSAAVTIAASATIDLTGDDSADNFAATFSAGTAEIDGVLLAGPIAAGGGGATGSTLEIGAGGTADVAAVTVRQGGTLVLAGGVLGPSVPITVDAGATVTGYGTVEGTVTNFGMLIVTGGLLSIAGALDNSGGVTIGAGSSLAATSGLYDSGSLTNGGLIAQTVTLHSGVSLTNVSGGTIGTTGTVAASVYGVGEPATVTNYGLIFAANETLAAIALTGGGMVTNSGSIGGAIRGVIFENAAGTLVNSGSITVGATHSAVALLSGGQVTNAAGSLIESSGGPGIYGTNAAVAVSNAGIILSGSDSDGIRLLSGGYVSNASSGEIQGTTFSGIFIEGAAGTVLNAGLIESTGTGGNGVNLEAGGVLSNASTGTISALNFPSVYVGAAGGIVTNAGFLSSSLTTGLELTAGVVTNEASGTVTGIWGVGFSTGPGTLFNYGSIVSVTVHSAVFLDGGGIVTNETGGLINSSGGTGIYATNSSVAIINAGRIVGGGSALVLEDGGTVTNLDGTITAASADGVFIGGGPGTIVNAGSIGGAENAVYLSQGSANRVIMDPSAVFSGTVNGGNTINATAASTLELATGTSVGMLAGLGSQYINFAQITVDSGAAWTLSGANSLASGATLTNLGTLTISGNVSGDGELDIDGGATLALSGTLGAATSTLLMGDEVVLAGGSPGDTDLMPSGTIDVSYLNFTTGGSASVDSSTDVLAVSVGGTTYTQQLSGDYTGDQFALDSDGADGTDVTMDVAVQGDTVTVMPLSSQPVSLDQLIANSTIAPSGTIQSLVLNGPGTATVSGIVSINNLEISEGQLAMSGGTVDTDPVTIAANGDISGYGTITGAVTNVGTITAIGGTLELTGSIAGVGLLAVDPGATLLLDLGANVGAVTVNSGSLGAAGELEVGQAGLGGLLVENQATATIGTDPIGDVQGLDIGATTGEPGDAVVTGSESLLTNTGQFVVGDGGLGSLSIQAGGTVITIPGVPVLANAAVIGNTAGAAGSSVNVSGAGSDWQVGGSLVVGNAAEGSLNISAGGSVSAAALDAAAQAGADGIISVTGTASALTLAGRLTLGDQAAGELSILGGATVSAQALTVGNASTASSGNVDVEGTGSTLQIDTGGLLNVGYAGGGSGELTIGQGSTLQFEGVVTEAGRASFNNNGGVIDPDSIEFTTAANAGLGENDYSLYVGNINAVQIDSGTGIWNTPMILTGTSVADAATNISNYVNGEWQLSNGGTLIINANTVDAGQAIVFEDATDTLVIGQVVNGGSAGISGVEPTITAGVENLLASGGFAAQIWGYAEGDKIEFNNLTIISDSIVNGNTLDLFGSGDTFEGSLTFYTGNGAHPLGSTAMQAAEEQVICFCAGTLIGTPSGEVPVERLKVGDIVLTHRGEARPITWIGEGRVLATRGRRTAATPVIVRKGALAENVPHRDLRVTKGHSFYLDGVLIPAEFLVNHRSILWDDHAQEVHLYHIELASHDVLMANGAPAESYRDDGNRWLFQNANSGWDLPSQRPCAPVLTGGPIVDAAWRRLLDLAGPCRSLLLTSDPDLYLQVDGKRIDAIERRDDMHVFRLRARPRNVRVCSRAAVPAELGIARDNRELGVAIRRIVLAQPRMRRAIEANEGSLIDGYHAFEPDNGIRWTDGDAAVPVELFAGMNGPGMLMLHLGGATQYLDDGAAVRVA
jgi:T5SS/PEP-CTERM-associated repeat protein